MTRLPLIAQLLLLSSTVGCWAPAQAECPEGARVITMEADPDGSDETDALAAALGEAGVDDGPTCVVFAAGRYETTTGLPVNRAVSGGLTLVGEPGAILTAAADVPLITTTNWLNVEPGDALTIEGLTLVGAPGGSAPIIFANAIDAAAEGYAAKPAPADLDACLDDQVTRLPLRLRDTRISNPGGAAIHLHSLIDAELSGVHIDSLEGSAYGVYVSGSRGRLAIDGLVDAGSALGVFASNGALRACLDLVDVELAGGLFISVGEGSWVEARGVRSAAPPLYLHLRESTGRFSDAELATGSHAGGPSGQLYYPRDVRFDRVTFTAARGTDAALVIYWSVEQQMVTGQSVRFEHSRFVAPDGAARAVLIQANRADDDNMVSMWGGHIGPGFGTGVDLSEGGQLAVDCLAMDARTGFELDATAARPCEVTLAGVDYGATATPVEGLCQGPSLTLDPLCGDPIGPLAPPPAVGGPIGAECFPAPEAGCPAPPVEVLYLAPAGFPRADDRPRGSLTNPFADPQEAVDQLAAGVELRVFGGRYPISGQMLDLNDTAGAACAPAVMRAVGDRPVTITGARPEWRGPAPGEWTPIDVDGVTVYRSPAPVTDLYTDDWIIYSTSAVPFFGYYRHGDAWIALVSYTRHDEFTAASSAFVPDPRDTTRANAPYYVGPGVFFDQAACRAQLDGRAEPDARPDACHVFVRLDPTATGRDLGYDIDPDPAAHELLLITDEQVTLNRSAHLRISGIEFIGLNRITAHNAHHLTLDGNRVLHRAYLDVYNSENDDEGASVTRSIRISGNHIGQGFPPYVYWNDLKANGTYRGEGETGGPARRFHHPAVLLRGPNDDVLHPELRGPRCVAVTDNVVERVWFGISAPEADDATLSYNRITFAHDDGIMVYGNESQRVEVAHNAIFDSLNGITQVPVGHDMSLPPEATSTDGPFWVHHNVVDLSRTMDWPIPYMRPGFPGEARHRNGDPGDLDYGFLANYALFVGHASGHHTAMQVYNNVFITTNSPQGRGVVVVPYNHGGAVRGHFMNNVVVQRDPAGHIYALMNVRDRQADAGLDFDEAAGTAGTLVDGNVYWRGGMGGVPGAEAPFVYDGEASCAGSDVYGASPYLFSSFYYTTDVDPDAGPDCRFTTSSGACVDPSWRRLGWRALRDFLCHQPLNAHRVRRADGGYDPIDPFVSSQGWQTEPWLAGQWAGLMAHDRFVDPRLEAGTYRVDQAHRTAPIATPAAWPEGGAPYLGACGEGPCPHGPRAEQ